MPVARCQRALAERVGALLDGRAVGVFDQAAMHVPIDVARAARDVARSVRADALVSVGGGSTTGLAKAVALESGLPILALPTTYAGSEMTSIFGLTEAGAKRTGRDERVRPKTVIYDPALTLDLSWPTTVTSAFNAIAHAAEGLYAPDVDPLTALMADEGLRATTAALKALHIDARSLEARSDALYGAWLCGAVLGVTTMGLHHKLCHTLGGSFDLPHAAVHTVVLAHALAYNASSAPLAMARITRALSSGSGKAVDDAPRAVFALAEQLGAPTSLAQIGMAESSLDRAAELAVQTPYPNPRPLELAPLRALLQRAFDGAAPQA
jgi:maleylacetate reductase